jgi:DNA-binding IclR family transcriptional regulator
VLRALTRAGGALSTTELAYQTRLAPSTLQDTLAELEEHGLVTPWAWTLGPEHTA